MDFMGKKDNENDSQPFDGAIAPVCDISTRLQVFRDVRRDGSFVSLVRFRRRDASWWYKAFSKASEDNPKRFYEEIKNAGADLEPWSNKAGEQFRRLIAEARTIPLTLSEVIGWHPGHQFLTPNRCIGKVGKISPILHSSHSEAASNVKSPLQKLPECPFDSRGELTLPPLSEKSFLPLKHALRDACAHSNYIMFAFCAGLVGPLLRIPTSTGPSQREGFSIVFSGPSSTGKTTLLLVAASARRGITRQALPSLRATGRGREEQMHECNHATFVMDELTLELAKASAGQVRDLAFLLSSEGGKRRSQAKSVQEEWRDLEWIANALFTTEEDVDLLPTRMSLGGEQRRMPQVKIPALEDGGIFDIDPPRDTKRRELVEKLLNAAATQTGYAYERFVDAMINYGSALINDSIVEFVETFVRKAVARYGALNGIEAHVASNFGLIAAAGEIAIWAKIIPAKKGDARRSALTIFERHILDRRRSPYVRSGEDALLERLSQLKEDASRFPRRKDIEAGRVTDPKIWGYTQTTNGEMQIYVEKSMLNKSFPDHPLNQIKQILAKHNRHIKNGRESPFLDRKISNYPGEIVRLKFLGIRLY